MTETLATHVAVVGAGPGGYAAAFHAADLGMDVTLIDVETNPGGTCLYRGCIPSKALLHVAKLINDTREAAEWGLTFGAPEMNLEKVRQKTHSVVEQMTRGLGQLCQARRVRYLQARASFLDSKTLAIFHQDGSEEVLHAEYTIIASGSRPTLFGPLIDSPRLMNSTNALQMEEIPDTLLVVGGGYIGLELGTVYASLGAKVTVVEMTDGLLPGADRDLVKPLQTRLENLMHGMLFRTKVAEVKEQDSCVCVVLEGPDGTRQTHQFDKVLVCVGRKPNSSGLNLASTKVVVNERGFIEVDLARRTAEPNIFAVGDVTGEPMLAHKASAEGRVAAEVIAGHDSVFEPMAIPAVVFTDPEVAWCGLTETLAEKQGRAVRITRFPWAASGRASTLSRPEGLTKLICDPETNQILGMGIAGAGAGELIAEGALAIEMGALANDLDMTIHPHPTLSETVMESAAVVFGTSTHLYRPRKK
jgi:dihydrolipoamide dehydrogenase